MGKKKWIQNEMCSISEIMRVGKEEMGQNPCASCGASPYLRFLPDFSLVALPDRFFLVSLFHSVLLGLLYSAFPPFISTGSWNGCGFVLTVFPRGLFPYWNLGPQVLKGRTIHPQHPGCLQTLYPNSVREQIQRSAVTKSLPHALSTVPVWAQRGVGDTV